METISTIRINQINDLEKLRSLPITQTFSDTKIILNLPKLKSKDNTYWQKKLNQHAFACGCKEGAIASLIGIIAMLFIIHFNEVKFHSWPDFLSSSTIHFSILLFTLITAFGKISAIFYSRWQFKKIISMLIKIHCNH